MIQNCLLQGNADKVGNLDTVTEEALLAKQLVSQIVKGSDHISLTLTAKGIAALTRELSERLLAEKAAHADCETDEGLLTKQQVMETLSVSSTTLWLWEQKGYLIPVKIGRKVFYRSKDISNLRNGK